MGFFPRFPPAPSVGEQFSADNGGLYQWDGVKWVSVSAPRPLADIVTARIAQPRNLASFGFNQEYRAGAFRTINTGPSARIELVAQRAELEFKVAAPVGAGQPVADGRPVIIDSDGVLTARGGLRSVAAGAPATGTYALGVGGAYIHFNSAVGSGWHTHQGSIWHDGVNLGVRNNDPTYNLQMWWGSPWVHLQINTYYRGGIWHTGNFDAGNLWSKGEIGSAYFLKSNGQSLSMWWDGYLQPHVGATHVGSILTNANFTGSSEAGVFSYCVQWMRTIYQGAYYGGVSGPFTEPFSGAAISGWGANVHTYHFRQMQFLQNHGWYVVPYV